MTWHPTREKCTRYLKGAKKEISAIDLYKIKDSYVEDEDGTVFVYDVRRRDR